MLITNAGKRNADDNADENADNDWGKNLAKGATAFASLISTQF